MLINDIVIRYILNSRGLPTMEAELVLYCTEKDEYFRTRASTSMGISCGGYERSMKNEESIDVKLKRARLTVSWANGYVTDHLIGLSLYDIFDLDRALLALPEFEKDALRFAVMTSISVAGYRAYGMAMEYDEFSVLSWDQALKHSEDAGAGYVRHMPRPLFNMINGGLHATIGGSVQEYLVIPLSSSSFEQSLEMGLVIHEKLRQLLKHEQVLCIGDEGGWMVHEKDPKRILDLLSESVNRSNYIIGKDVMFGLDVAASMFYEHGIYHFNGKKMRSEDMIAWYEEIVNCYAVGLLEDALCYSDEQAWQDLYQSLSDRVWLTGDDLFATQLQNIENSKARTMSNAVIAKPNQSGTVLRLHEFCDFARRQNWPVIMSHRSGDTEESYIANLAVDFACQGIKSGGLARSERLAKYNQMLRIEEYLKRAGRYGGMSDFVMKK